MKAFLAFFKSPWHFKSKLKHNSLSYHAQIAPFSTLHAGLYGLFYLLRSQHKYFIILENSFTQNMKFLSSSCKILIMAPNDDDDDDGDERNDLLTVLLPADGKKGQHFI